MINFIDLFKPPKAPTVTMSDQLDLMKKMMSIINDLTSGLHKLTDSVKSQQDSFNLYIATNKEVLDAYNERLKKLERTTRI